MQTQNTELTLHFLEMSAEKALQQGSALVERLNLDAAGWTAGDRPPRCDEHPPLIRADHTTDIDRELLVRLHDPKDTRRVPDPDTTDEEVTHNPTLTRDIENLAQ